MSQKSKRRFGTVKFFSPLKGYGFVIPDEYTEEAFVHHSAIVNTGGFRSLQTGERVEFDLINGSKGLQAQRVTAIGGQPLQTDPSVYMARYHFSDVRSQQWSQMQQISTLTPIQSVQPLLSPTNGYAPVLMSPIMVSENSNDKQQSPSGYWAYAWPYGYIQVSENSPLGITNSQEIQGKSPKFTTETEE